MSDAPVTLTNDDNEIRGFSEFATFKLFMDDGNGERDVTDEWRLVRSVGKINVIVPESAKPGETYTLVLRVEGNTGFERRFDVVIAGFTQTQVSAGEQVELRPVGFPPRTQFVGVRATVYETQENLFTKVDADENGQFVILQVPESPDGTGISVVLDMSSICSVDEEFVSAEKYTLIWHLDIVDRQVTVDRSSLGWLALIPVGGLAIWGLSTIIGKIPGSSFPGQPDNPLTPGEPDKPDTPDQPDTPAVPVEPGAPVDVDAPRETITSVPSGATLLEAGIRTYI